MAHGCHDRHINDRDHPAFLRLFGAKPSEEDDFLIPLRPVQDVIQRLLWDKSLDINEFSFMYEDRYDGLKEMPGPIVLNLTPYFKLFIPVVNSPNLNVKGKERLLIKAVPAHRIKSVKYLDRVVWNKDERIDCFFGSQGDSKIEDVVETYDVWNEEQRQKKTKIAREIQLFVDLDGVLVDFDAGVRKIFGKNPSEIAPKMMWPRLARTPGFYENLPWMRDGRELWEVVRPYNPTICTGVPIGSWAGPQKMNWCKRELGAMVPVITCKSREKQLHCQGPMSILIDDRREIGASWEEAGGVFIHHLDAENSIKLFIAKVAQLLDG